MSMLSRSQRTAFKAEQINDAVVLERFQAKWKPVRVKKTRQIRNLEPRFDSIEAEKALESAATIKLPGHPCRTGVCHGSRIPSHNPGGDPDAHAYRGPAYARSIPLTALHGGLNSRWRIWRANVN
jgi:hypothetical protein